MASRIKSLWRMTWVQPAVPEVVLLDFGDWMLDEPTLPQDHEVQVQPFLRANWRTTYDRGNVGFETTFSNVPEFSSHVDLRNFVMDQSILVAGLRHGVLRVEIEGGNTYELRGSSIPSFNPQMDFEYVKADRLPLVYRVSGGELIKI